MRERYGARLYLFGSHARGTARKDSDYDLVAVSEAFTGQSRFERALDRRHLWRQAGGWGIPLDLHCYAPDEFRRAVRALGFLGQARVRGELLEIIPDGADARPAPAPAVPRSGHADASRS
ncbi:MAG: nucleotidyltransferase domain-containing protein [Chloroflexi bacterium]|nr:nucleotidyltransferase domain-containing protein [Chloroflexota bacterium]